MIALIEKGAGVPLYQIKITLKGSRPAIWRRIVIRADMPLVRFHRVIQAAMGWTDTHLHQFIAGGTFYALPDPEFVDMSPDSLNERSHTVADIAPAAKTRFIYQYE